MHVLNCNIMYATVIGLDVSIQFNALLAAGIGPVIHLCAYYIICVIGEVIRHVDVDCMLTMFCVLPTKGKLVLKQVT